MVDPRGQFQSCDILHKNSFVKGEAENAIVNTLSKAFQTCSKDTRNQQVCAYNHSFITVIQSYVCKQTPVSFLYSEKMDDVVLLNEFTKGFSASPFSTLLNSG